MNKKLDFYLKWVAVVVVCIGSAATSLNIYPAGPALLNLGTFLWLIVAIRMREPSLIAVNAVVLVIYSSGLLFKSMT